MNNPEINIDPTVLGTLLDLDEATGRLFWKKRSVELFAEAVLPGRTAATWNAKHAGKEAFNQPDLLGYKCGKLLGYRLRAHRVVWAMTHGRWPDLQIDHINGNPGDNRPCNLRSASARENSCNRRVRATSSSRYLGVSWHARGKRWTARICRDGRDIRLGDFRDEQEAARAYDAAAVVIHKQFARLNFPHEWQSDVDASIGCRGIMRKAAP